MSKSSQQVTIALDSESMAMLSECAAWRGLSVEELAKAYVEDWLDIDFPESRGRLTRRGINRDGPITLDPKTREAASQNWRDELGVKRLQAAQG